jgi:deazaflavin-dependent oxidoreductase (nitroreductase family)
MISNEQVFDSPRGFVKAHIKEFVESGGKKGGIWLGAPALLLITRGRKTGKLRRTGLIYGRDGGNYLLVASNGGSPKHPLWYLNLVANPQVELQVGADRIAGRARIADKDEKPRLWELMAGLFPRYNEYQAKAGRDIPLVIVETV